MSDFPIGHLDRSVVLDPGETVEALHRLLDLVSIQLCLVRPNPPSFFVPLAVHWHPTQAALEVLFARLSGEGIRVIYRAERSTHAELRPAKEEPVSDLTAAIDELYSRSPAGCFWARLDDDLPTYWHYDRGDWAYQLVASRVDLEHQARQKWHKTHFTGQPPAFVSWMDHTVATIESASQA